MGKLSVLVIEDDPHVRRNMSAHLIGHDVDFAAEEAQAREALRTSKPDICFIDLQLGVGDKCSGLNLIPLAKARGSFTTVMSSHDSDPYVEEANALGCDLFFAKGDLKRNMAEVFSRFEQHRRRAESATAAIKQYLTVDPATQKQLAVTVQFAPSELPLMLLGPSGTGKTTLARIIHDLSHRPGPFVAINCSSFTEELLELELLGCKKGAFTDAREDRKGKLLLADKGTLFLDEVGAMTAKMQTKLLKVIEEKVFVPLGGEEPETSDFRIISATLEEPTTLVSTGKLRLDFFERIQGKTIRLSGLAQRVGDIQALLAHFNKEGRKLSFTPEAKARLARHTWPGNTRELKKLVEILKADEAGTVTEDRVNEVLESVPILSVQANTGLTTEDQYRYALTHGLPALIDQIEETIVRRNLRENGGKKRRVLGNLKISSRLLYGALGRIANNGPKSETP